MRSRNCEKSRDQIPQSVDLPGGDQEPVRTGSRQLAQHDGDVEVIAEAVDGEARLSLIRQHQTDVVLIDIRTPRLDGIAATARILADPDLVGVRVPVLTAFDEDADICSRTSTRSTCAPRSARSRTGSVRSWPVWDAVNPMTRSERTCSSVRRRHGPVFAECCTSSGLGTAHSW